MSDRESKAAEDFQAFELLRSRFGGTKKPQHPPQRREKRRRRDPRFEAPPLRPLVEEDLSEAATEVAPTSPLTIPASNGLNTELQCNGSGNTSPHRKLRPNACGSPYKYGGLLPTDLDTVETASQTSQSSAYFSLTPTLGSVTELSETASIESYNEYDLKRKTSTGMRTTCLREAFETLSPTASRPNSGSKAQSKSSSPVHRMHRPFSAGSEPKPRPTRVSNEIRMPPPPPPPPQFDSLEDLPMESSSKVSLLSVESNSSECLWNTADAGNQKPGTFVKKTLIASTSDTTSSPSVVEEDDASTVVTDINDIVTPHASQESNSVLDSHNEVGIISRRVSIREITVPLFAQVVVVEEKKETPQPMQIKPAASATCAWERARQKYQRMKQRSLQDVSNSAATATPSEPVTETKEEPSESTMVEERARVFGGVSRRGMLRRTQSFRIGPRQTANITTRLAPKHRVMTKL